MVDSTQTFKRFKYIEGVNYFGTKKFESVESSITQE